MMSQFIAKRIRFAAATVLAIATLGTNPAFAATCSDLSRDYDQARSFESRVIQEYPGSTLVFAGCSAAAIDKYQRSGSLSDARGTLAACAMLGCSLTSDWKGCMGANISLLLISLQKRSMSDSYRRNCY
jgi:hypothetical protein